MPTIARDAILKPPLSTDSPWHMVRRAQFDFGNESLLLAGVRPDVLFIGDSITHVWELQAYFGAGNILVNRGIGGDTTTLLRERFAADALQLRPRRIVMKIGTNDLGWEMPQLSREVMAAVVENIAGMAADAQAAGIPLALCSLLPIWGPSWLDDPAFAPAKNAQIVEVNAGIRQIANRHGACYIDYYSALVGPDGQLPHDYADDGVHPHHAGYAVMTGVLKEALGDELSG